MKRVLTTLSLIICYLSLSPVRAEVDPNFYIYICFGQSNMEGNAQPEAIDKQNIDNRFRLLATCNFSNPSRTKGNWYKATPPLVSPNGGLGPTDYFGRLMVENLPEEVRVGVIPVAMGGSPIEMFDKDKYQKKMKDNPNEWWVTLAKNHYGGNPYGRIIEMAKKAQQVGVIKGILLHQGCSNNTDPNWPNMVKKIYNDMLADLGLGTDTVPLFVGETLRQDQGGACYGHNVQIDKMPTVIKNSYVISSENCPGNGSDPWHFNALGYRMMGSRYAAEGLYTLGVQYPYFSFRNYDFIPNKNCTYTASTRTMTIKANGSSGLCAWTYPHFADWSEYKYLIVKLKQPQTIDAEVWLYGKNKSVSYRDSIKDRTTVVIDLHNLMYNKTVMDPSKVYKMAIRSAKAGKIVIDDVFLSNDEEYTAIRNAEMPRSPFNAPLYSLDGRLADPKTLKPGVYVQQNKKVLIK